jgi:hypothetical protein
LLVDSAIGPLFGAATSSGRPGEFAAENAVVRAARAGNAGEGVRNGRLGEAPQFAHAAIPTPATCTGENAERR